MFQVKQSTRFEQELETRIFSHTWLKKSNKMMKLKVFNAYKLVIQVFEMIRSLQISAKITPSCSKNRLYEKWTYFLYFSTSVNYSRKNAQSCSWLWVLMFWPWVLDRTVSFELVTMSFWQQTALFAETSICLWFSLCLRFNFNLSRVAQIYDEMDKHDPC